MNSQPLEIADAMWLAKPVPRYTSYPPAPAFHQGVQGEHFATALRSLPPSEPVALYIHMPFCRNLCLYCGCHTFMTQRDDRIDAYLEGLKTEIANIKRCLGEGRKVKHIHFGGGSPNIMSESALRDLFTTLNQSFDLTTVNEIAMELDPRLVNMMQVALLVELGVTRISLGVQDFNARVQEAINRVQPYEKVAEICLDMRVAGISNINFDMMYGLPCQTPETIIASALLARSLEPSRISFFSYAHVPHLKPHQRALETLGLPDKQMVIDQERAGRDIWENAGYAAVGMDHFALPHDGLVAALFNKTLRRNFQGYTDQTTPTLIGLGASSISKTSDAYFQNEKDVSVYTATSMAGRLPIVGGIMLTKEDKLRAAIIERLMCDMSCDVYAQCEAFGFPPSTLAVEMQMLAVYAEAGLVTLDKGLVSLATQRRMAIRVIAHVFDRYTTAAATVAA